MVSSTVRHFAETSVKKKGMLEGSLPRYFVLSMMAGVYVGFGVILIFSIGAPLDAAHSAGLKALMGASFGIALTLVIFAGSELFTGNNMVMTIGALSGKVTWTDTLRLWTVCYLGNLAGSLLLALAVAGSGLASDAAASAFVLKVTRAKMNGPFLGLFLNGILCNVLVCLAVWLSARAKEDTAKIFLIFWCLFAFIGSGYEHSVANMTLLGVGIFLSHDPGSVSWLGFARNLVPVTLGNIVGGAVFVGAAYWYVAREPGPARAAARAFSPDPFVGSSGKGEENAPVEAFPHGAAGGRETVLVGAEGGSESV
jgi:nitrite transporter